MSILLTVTLYMCAMLTVFLSFMYILTVTTCLMAVAGGSKGRLPVGYLSLHESSFLHQSNYVKLTALPLC